MHNAPHAGSGDGPDTSTVVHPLLDGLLRRCPLLPSEVTRIEQLLPLMLDTATPEAIARQIAAALERRPADMHRQLCAQVAAALREVTLTHAARSSWREECRRVAGAIAEGVLQLYAQRSVGGALYAVTNRAFGAHGVQALHWAIQTRAAAALLAQDAWLPWLQWLCQLPLPSLREGRWLEPLLAVLPAGLRTAAEAAGESHDLLQRALLPPASTVRLMLLGTTWVLWQRHANVPAPAPSTATGRCLAALPLHLAQLEAAGGAARRLFAAPTLSAARGGAGTAALLPVATAAALLPLARPASRGALPVAAAGLAMASLLPAGEARDRPAQTADTQDAIAVVEALWAAWDTAAVDGPVNLSTRVFDPLAGGRYARQCLELRQRLVSLYHQDDFLGALYRLRVPPGTLRLRDGILSGQRVHAGTPVQLHPPVEREAGAAWSSPTADMLGQLLAAAGGSDGCYDHAGPRLECALRFVLVDGAADGLASTSVLGRFIHTLEATLPSSAGVTVQRERLTLQWLRARIAAAQVAPIRGLPPTWPSGRPDPRSHLGHNLHLARGALLRLSAHPAMQALCDELGADPGQLVFPSQGDVVTRIRGSTTEVSLFQADQPPAALARLAAALRRLATLLHAPVRANGIMQVPEMLAYYAVPWPGAPLDDAPFTACLDALDTLLETLGSPAPATTVRPAPSVAAVALDQPPPRGTQQALIDRLWQVFDGAAGSDPVNLRAHAFIPLPEKPLAHEWAAAQQQLAALFEATAPWLAMRQVDASFHSLRVADGRIVVAARTDQRELHLSTSGWAGAGHDPAPLFHAARAFGCLSPSDGVPLGSALHFHGIARRAPTQACHAQPLATLSERLQLLHQVHAQWLPAAEQASPYLQDMGDLHDVLGLDAGSNTDAYRPTLGTTAAAASYAALGPLALLLENPEIQAVLAAPAASPQWVSVDAEGTFTAHFPDDTSTSLPASRLVGHSSEHATLLALLRTHAARVGGSVRSDARVNATRVLALNGECGAPIPRGGTALQRCAEHILGELRLGLRPQLVHARDLLDAAQLQQLRDATEDFLTGHAPPDTTLLEYLGAPVVERGELAWSDVDRVDYFLSELARTPRAGMLQHALLEALGWHGSLPGASTSASLLGSLTVVAIVADLGPPSQREARIVLGYRLHKQANRGRTFAAVRDDFDTYLYSLGRLPSALHAMATAVALQEDGPELLATDIPTDLLFGSAIAAVDYISGVHVAERIQRGLSRRMNFTALVALAAGLARDPHIPDEVRRMALDAHQLPLLDWMTFRSLEDTRFGIADATAALRAFDDRVARVEEAINDLLAPVPYRMAMVQAELQRVFPTYPGVFAPLPWNASQLRLCNNRAWMRHSFPLYELYASGELHRAAGDWTLCRVPAPQASRIQGYPQREALEREAFAQMQPQFHRLADINARFESAHATYLHNARRGYAVLIEEALYLRPNAERIAIQRGEVEIFTLRTHEPQLEAQQETAADTDPYRGRFGIVYSVRVEGSLRYFQLFPLQSRIVPLAVDGVLPIGGVLETRKVRLRQGHYATVKVRRGTPLNVDWEAYASYRAPVPGRQSRVIVERLQATRRTDDTGAARSPFHALVSPLQHDFFWLDPVALHHETRAPTSFEAHLAAPPLWLAAVDFIVPFVENLRKISSTDRDEFAMAAFGLYLEGVLIVGPVVGGVAKVLSRAGPRMTRPRFGELARVLAHGTLDALNPLAGSLTIARLGVSVVSRGLSGDLQFAWSRIRHPGLRSSGWRWVMRQGMALLKEGDLPHAASLQVDVRTVDNIRSVLVVRDPTSPSLHGYHLLDPATLSPYGPLLQPGLDSSNAAGMLLKVGGGLHGSRPSAGKVLKPMKQGTKASQDDPGEQQGTVQPQAIDLAYPFLRTEHRRPAP